MTVRVASYLSALVAVACLGTPAMAQGDDLAAGRAEYRISCEGCHGASGKGDGEVAPLLTVKPADLTQLAKKNDGKYPFLKVFQTIDGRAVVKGHGVAPMPIWGNRYKDEAVEGAIEPYNSYSAEPIIRARILELTYFIQSLQE